MKQIADGAGGGLWVVGCVGAEVLSCIMPHENFGLPHTDIVLCVQMGMHFGGDAPPILVMRFEPRPHVSSIDSGSE